MLHRHGGNARESRNDSVSHIGTPRADRKDIPGSEAQTAGSKEFKSALSSRARDESAFGSLRLLCKNMQKSPAALGR